MNSEANSYDDPYSTKVDRFAGSNNWYGSSAETAARRRAMELAGSQSADAINNDAQRAIHEQISDARTAANEAYPKLLDYLATCSKNLASMRASALDDDELSRDNFDLAA